MADDQQRPPQAPAPLEPFHGAVPPSPDWFKAAIAREPERSMIPVQGADIELLTWGEVGKPGLLFLHGNGAHADWWSFIAPFFADDYRVAAISWSGMGGSSWREQYSGALFVEEIFAAIAAARLNAAGKPVIIGHSFGGFPTMLAAAQRGDELRGAVAVDSPVRPPEKEWRGPPQRTDANRVYPTIEAALARFRLAPPQGCENLYIADFIARRSLKEVEGGWTWRFDPFIWREFRMDERSALLAGPKCPLAMIWGDRSSLIDPEILEYMSGLVPADTPKIAIPDAEHHVMLDQPLAVVAALRGLLSAWPKDA